MWTRRLFLQSSSMAVAAMTCLPASASPVKTGPLGLPIGIQVYTVKDAAAKDFAGTLKKIADVGYREIELAGQPELSLAAMRKLLADTGLDIPSMHTNMADLQTNAQKRIDYAKELGIDYLVCSFPRPADGRSIPNSSLAAGMTLDDWKWNADQLNKVGELARKSGVKFGYHNHNIEFRSYNGVVAMDEMIRTTDPKLVTYELDVAWVATAGVDPVQYLKKHADRISLLHVKDIRKDAQQTIELKAQTTEVGSGSIDWKAFFAAAKPGQIKHYFVEQENFERDPLEAIKISFGYLSKLGAAS